MENLVAQENISEPISQKPIEQEQAEKEKMVTKKKKLFLTLLYVLGTLFIVITIFVVGVTIYKKYFVSNVPVVTQAEPEEPKENTTPNLDVEKTALYKSDNLKLSLEYSKEAKLVDTWASEDQTKKLEIFFSKDATTTEGTQTITDGQISEGYIFRVSTFNTNIRNLDEIARVKKESIVAGCPETAEFSETYPAKINDVDSRVFEVKNCNGDFMITYTPRFGVYYAFEQIYKGDIGYKQKQKASTQEILDSVRFYPEDTGPELPYDTYISENPKFTFEHPKFDASCCNLPGPPSNDKIIKLVTLADKDTYVDSNNFDGFSVFSYTLGREDKGGFSAFLDNQKKILIDDYVVVRGTNPKLQEVSIMVGDKEATLLRGYSWRETDLIYFHITSGRSDYALIISVRNMTGDNFEKKMDRVLSSFKFL